MQKTLYISDLDGTLLHSNEKISNYSVAVLNRLIREGILFTYATARSHVTSTKIMKGLTVSLPLILYNGAFMKDMNTGKILLSNFFTPSEVQEIDNDLKANQVNPIVYSLVNTEEKFSYLPHDTLYQGLWEFLKNRPGDSRHRPVQTREELLAGETFYFTCIETHEKLAPVYEKYKERFHCIFGRDIYSGEWWLEILPPKATKAHAVLQLKEYLGCDKLIVFGDGLNDIEMFHVADECYAVENAAPELKEIADSIIDSNNSDGVARWLEEHCTITS